MKPSFVHYDKPTLTALFRAPTKEEAINIVKRSLADGAEAFCIQTCFLRPEYRNDESYKEIFAAMGNRPIYVTNYRGGTNTGVPDEELSEGLLHFADLGVTLCDVMGDIFDPTPGELTMDPVAIEKQKALIDQLHAKGAEVLMSSHISTFLPAERVLEIAKAHESRGVDIVKIVTKAETVEQELENIRITHLLKQELKIPFVFLSACECKLHRRIGPMLGCCMYLCAWEFNPEKAWQQPQIWKAKAVRDSYDW